jgi:hypothetical protein
MAGGRPRKEIDWDEVRRLAEIQCTQEEVASVLGVALSTLKQYPQFSAIHKEGSEAGRKSLRRLQWDKANSGNTAMLIWLGKQYLGQRDRVDHTVAERPEDILEDFTNASDNSVTDSGE